MLRRFMDKHEKCLFGKDEVLARLTQLREAGRPLRADFNLACLISDNALALQTDRGGRDYGHHTTRVSQHNAPNNLLMIIGKLHDVVEDSDWTLCDLRAAGFSERIINAVDALTHRDGEKYLDSIERAGDNKDAVMVKLADLKDNMSVSRLTSLPTASDLARLRKYTIAFNYLEGIREGTIPCGLPLNAFIAQHPELNPGPEEWATISTRPLSTKPERNCWLPPRLQP